MDWTYVNPFWHSDTQMTTGLGPDECRSRLEAAPTSPRSIRRIWLARGDFNFAQTGPRLGSLLEMHVRVDVTQPAAPGSVLRLRFSAGLTSAVVMCLVAVGCAAAFLWAASSLLLGSGWTPLHAAALLAILVPVLLVLALRSSAPGAEQDLWDFVAEQVEAEDAAPEGQ